MTADRRNRDRLMAAAFTFLALLLILLILFFGKIGWNRDALAAASIPEPADEEEIEFLEPELLTNAGEEEPLQPDQAAAPTAGIPETAPEANRRISEPQPDPGQAPPKERLVSRKDPSPVEEPKRKNDEEKKKATEAVAGKFHQNNGLTDGKFDSAGSSGSSAGIAGYVDGRQFLGCPKPDVTLSHKTTVKVNIMVNAAGKVVSAEARGGASASIRRACENAARQARWSPKEGAPDTRGSITFTITPR